MSKSHAHLRETVKQLASKSSIKKSLSTVIEGPGGLLFCFFAKLRHYYFVGFGLGRDFVSLVILFFYFPKYEG